MWIRKTNKNYLIKIWSGIADMVSGTSVQSESCFHKVSNSPFPMSSLIHCNVTSALTQAEDCTPQKSRQPSLFTFAQAIQEWVRSDTALHYKNCMRSDVVMRPMIEEIHREQKTKISKILKHSWQISNDSIDRPSIRHIPYLQQFPGES